MAFKLGHEFLKESSKKAAGSLVLRIADCYQKRFVF